MSTDTLSLPALKAQAKRLRDGLGAQGTILTHSQALELVAHQHGARDWNTLRAQTSTTTPEPPRIGARVSGTYLGHAFTGTLKGITRTIGRPSYRVTVRFDAPIDVVRFASFSAWRSQINAVIDETGRAFRRTSDGEPHLVLKWDPA